MIYSEKYQFIFFCIPKCASSTVTYALGKHFGIKKWNDVHDCYVPNQFQNFFKFASIRNPYDRAISGWKYLKKARIKPSWDYFHMVSIKDFLANQVSAPSSVHENTLFKHLRTNKPGPKIDKFLRVETLEDDFNSLPFVKTPIKLPVKNRSSITLSEKEIKQIHEYVANNYKEDIELWESLR